MANACGALLSGGFANIDNRVFPMLHLTVKTDKKGVVNMAERRDLINAEGHLMFGGCDTVMLAKTYGTPLYVVDGAMVEEKMLECRQAMAQCFDSYKVFYASKALCAKAIYKLAEKTGLHLDVVSAGELKMALESGMPGERIALHGNVKLYPELSMAAENGCTVNIDSIEEIEDVQAVAAEKGTVVPVLVRVTPGVEAHTHAYIQTGIEDCKFALGIENGMAMEAIRRILACKNLAFRGIHGHIGSQILESEPYYPTGKNLAAFALKVESETGAKVQEINLGGGFGIRYTKEDHPLPILSYLEKAKQGLLEAYKAAGKPLPTIGIEPGRCIVGEAGLTLYTVALRKEIPGVRTYVSVDGGMADNLRVSLYQAEYEGVLANRMNDANEETVRIAGRCCESGDILISEIALPRAKKGDTLAMFATGAYCYAMASNYNKLPIAPMVMVKNGAHGLMVRGQSLEDMTRFDTVPEFLGEEK